MKERTGERDYWIQTLSKVYHSFTSITLSDQDCKEIIDLLEQKEKNDKN